jgi:hypothetical protein
MNDIRTLISSDAYNAAIERIKKKVKIKVNSDYIDRLIEFDKKNLEVSAISIAEIVYLLNLDCDKVVEFAVEKLRKYDGVEAEQEYPEDEEPEEDAETNVQYKGYATNFLLMYMIEYFLLKNRPDALEPYLQARRTPHARKYARELRDLFHKVLPG